MSLQVGIIGTPGSGKSTLFHCLTGINPPPGGKLEMVRGVAEVKDDRLVRLAEVFQSRKITPISLEFLDAPPLETGGLKKESFRQNFLRGLGQADALLLVLPYFQEEHRHRVLTLAKEIETEFILCDLLGVESRSAKISRDLARGVKGEIQKEAEILERCRIALENEVSLRQVKFSEEELKHIRGFAFLSQKPLLTALNLAEEDLNRQSEILQEAQLSEAIPIGAKIEAEISDLAEADRELFLQDLGIMQSARERIIAQTRISLDLITFLTASEKEAHAWSLKRGANALKAAGVIHSDMEKGFIRAEVFPFEELNKYPFLHDLRAKGLIRLEGKDYIVQEGDVILFRFSI